MLLRYLPLLLALALAPTAFAQPDLVVTSVSAEPSSAEAGETVWVDYTIVNEGDEGAGRFVIGIYLSTDASVSASDQLVESSRSYEIRAGWAVHSLRSVTIPSDAEPGSYFLLVVADIGNVVSESEENNNTEAIPFTVTVTITTATEGTPDAAFRLAAPVPNPAAGRITLRYHLAEAGPVDLAVYDVLGRRVATLAEGTRQAGDHEVSWAASVAPGVYFMRLSAAGEVRTRQATVVR